MPRFALLNQGSMEVVNVVVCEEAFASWLAAQGPTVQVHDGENCSIGMTYSESSTPRFVMPEMPQPPE